MAEAKLTRYVVLKQLAADGEATVGAWDAVDTVSAASATEAIRVTAETFGAGEYVAVPARSWKPRKAEIQTTPRVRLS